MNRCILLLLTGFVLYWACIGLSDHPQRKLSLVDLLPQETVAVIESKNLGQAYTKMQHGGLGKVLSRPDFPAFVRRLDFTDQQLRTLLAMTGAFNGLAHNANLLSLLSHDGIVALLPLHPGERISLEQIGARVVFFQHMSTNGDLRQLFSKCFGRIRDQASHDYQGYSLTRLTFDQGKSLTYFTYTGVLVWSFEEQLLYPCINQLLQQLIPIRAGIQKHAAYNLLKKKAGRLLDTFIYIRLPALKSLFGCTAGRFSNKQLPCPDDLALFTTSMASGSRFAAIALTEREKIAAYVQKHHLKEAVENAPLGRLSQNTVFALWTNWFKPNLLWKEFKLIEFSPLQVLLQGWSEDMRHAFQLSLSDFFALFGSEFSLYIDQIPAPNEFPRSLISTSIEIKDRSKVEGLLKRMTKGLQTIEVISDGMRIISLQLAGGLLQPAYSFTKDHLILADSIELIERIHEKVTHPAQRIAPNSVIRTQRSNFFLFLRTGDMVDWLLPIMTAIAREFGSHSGENIDEWPLFHPLVFSILADLRQIETTRVRLYLAKNELFFEIISQPVPH